jgi:hypothetical protein
MPRNVASGPLPTYSNHAQRSPDATRVFEQLVWLAQLWDTCPKIVRETAFVAFFDGQPYPACP